MLSHFSYAQLSATPWTIARLLCPWDSNKEGVKDILKSKHKTSETGQIRSGDAHFTEAEAEDGVGVGSPRGSHGLNLQISPCVPPHLLWGVLDPCQSGQALWGAAGPGGGAPAELKQSPSAL